MSAKKTTESKSDDFALSRKNYRLFVIGLVILIIGYVLMIGGGSDDPNVFKYDELFSFRRITLSPIVILAGFVTIAISIVKKYD